VRHHRQRNMQGGLCACLMKNLTMTKVRREEKREVDGKPRFSSKQADDDLTIDT
jgi:hypothetical protein